MRWYFLVLSLFFTVILRSCVQAQTGELLLTVAFCPTAFSSGGAVIAVDTATGSTTIRGTFDWPSAILGCPALEDPTVTSDPSSGLQYLYFGDENLLVQLDLLTQKVRSAVTKNDEFFTGFTNMAVAAATTLQGLSPTVESASSVPYCSEGCFNFGKVDTDNGDYSNITDVPFKEAADDVAFVSPDGSTFYTQVSHDLRTDGKQCAPKQVDQCLLAIANGQMTQTIYTPFTIYQFGSVNPGAADDTVPVWLFWEQQCQQGDNSYLFGALNLTSGSAKPTACIPRDLVIDWDEWIGAFSLDNSLFATASGNSEGDPSQLLVFNTSTGVPLVNSQLTDIPRQLHAWSNLIFIWAVSFVKLPPA